MHDDVFAHHRMSSLWNIPLSWERDVVWRNKSSAGPIEALIFFKYHIYNMISAMQWKE